MAQQESNYNTVFNKNPLAMIIIEKDSYKFLDVNPAVTSIFGYPEEELLTMKFMDIVPEEDHSYLKEQLKKVSEDKDIKLYLRNIKKDGQVIDMYIIATQINFNNKDCILKIATGIQDIYFQELFNSSPFAIALLKDNEQITHVNKMFEELFKYTADEVKEKTLEEVIVPSDFISEHNDITQKVKNGEFVRLETKRKSKDDKLIDVIAVKFPIIINNKLKGSYAIFLDISVEKKMQKELNKLYSELENKINERTKELELAYDRLQEFNYELEDVSKSKDKLISIISHDLRNPLAAIASSSEILMKGPETLQKEEIASFTRIINYSSIKITNQLSELVEWSKQKIRKLNINSLNLYEFVAVSIELLEANAKQKDIKINNNIDKMLKVKADPLFLRSIFQNLIANSIKFTPKSGSITISALKKSNSCVEISIKDTGTGMPEEVKNKLFIEPDVSIKSGDETVKAKGLGLILVKDFVEKHKGKIWIESEPGKGTTFYFTLSSED